MAQLTNQEFKIQTTTLFPTNGAGAITATDVRTQMDNIADSAPFKTTGATSPPSVTDDGNNSGGNGAIEVGDIWIDETNDIAYICLDNSTGAAVWGDTTSTQNSVIASGTPLVTQLGVWAGGTAMEGVPELTWDGATFAIGGNLTFTGALAGVVSPTGTPVNNQLAVWTTATVIEGNANLTWDGAVLAIGGTDAINVPSGTTLERPAGAAGMIRYNSDLGAFEGYGAAWGGLGAGTDLAYTTAANDGTVTSSDGTDATIPAATGALAGLLTGTDKTKLDGITAGANVNVTTNLGFTTAATTGTVTSSDGTDAVILAATVSEAGLLTAADKTKLDSVEANATQYALAPIESVTGAYSVVLGDVSKYKETTDASPVTITINGGVGFAADDEIFFEQGGAGAITFAVAGGMTINSRGGLLSTAGQYGTAFLKFKSATVATLSGDLA